MNIEDGNMIIILFTLIIDLPLFQTEGFSINYLSNYLNTKILFIVKYIRSKL
jgi:hypothetical protein